MSRWLMVAVLGCGLAGCDWVWPWPEPAAPFTVQVVPTEITDSIPGQACVLLVTLENAGTAVGSTEPIRITVDAPGAYTTVEPELVLPGEMAEVIVAPGVQDPAAGPFPEEGLTISAVITGTRGGSVETVTVPVKLTSAEPDLVGAMATEIQSLFIPWLEANHPELGITWETTWMGTMVTPHILIVTHYLFFSAEWEMHVAWHVMIPPDDWARIELRRRFDETAPSLAFEIPSRSADPPVAPVAVEPSDTLWR